MLEQNAAPMARLMGGSSFFSGMSFRTLRDAFAHAVLPDAALTAPVSVELFDVCVVSTIPTDRRSAMPLSALTNAVT